MTNLSESEQRAREIALDAAVKACDGPAEVAGFAEKFYDFLNGDEAGKATQTIQAIQAHPTYRTLEAQRDEYRAAYERVSEARDKAVAACIAVEKKARRQDGLIENTEPGVDAADTTPQYVRGSQYMSGETIPENTVYFWERHDGSEGGMAAVTAPFGIAHLLENRYYRAIPM